ncbi:MAG: hypothetical protein QME90_14350 [Thermodesulfobacteriota bacterium]|nr:hypothetical protein [Thermodesulfobacteriota bacterium]
MDIIDLDNSLNQPPCPLCGKGRIRPIDIFDGKHLTFQCHIPECRWTGRAKLPEIRKKIIYLDTSTISHMARALKRNETDSLWMKLYERLQSAAGAEVICCPRSSIVQNEAELSIYSKEIIRLSQEFGNPGLKHELSIERAQIFRALRRFLSNLPPTLEIAPPIEDAFVKPINRWLPVYSISANLLTPNWMVEAHRSTKASMPDQIEKIYKRYEAEGLKFEDIRRKEADGFADATITIGIRSLRRWLGLESTPPGEEEIALFIPNTFDLLTHSLQRQLKISFREAISRAGEFLLSDHVRLIPVADIKAKLHAGLAMLCRGPNPRLPKPGDAADIDHIATFMPYMDIFIADKFFADLCNQKHLRLGELYGCEIRSLGPAEIPDFIFHLDKIVESAPQTTVAGRIAYAIHAGEFHQEFAQHAEAFLRSKGIDPYAKLPKKKAGEPD